MSSPAVDYDNAAMNLEIISSITNKEDRFNEDFN